MKQCQKIIAPAFFRKFVCIGGICGFDCCRSYWSICVDKDTYFKYSRLNDPEKKWLLGHITVITDFKKDSEYAQIVMEKDKGCPFLNDSGLCAIQCRFGEAYLNDTCRRYPRNYRLCNGRVEKSLHLTCPEAARLALLDPHAFTFEEGSEETTSDFNELKDKCDDGRQYLARLKYAALEMMKNSTGTDDEKLYALGCVMESFGGVESGEASDRMGETIQRLGDPKWPETLRPAFAAVEPDAALQVRAIAELMDFSIKFCLQGEYRKFGEELFSSIGIAPGSQLIKITDEVVNTYLDSYRRYYRPFTKQYPHMMRHLILHAIYSRWFSRSMNLITHYARLVMLYGVVRFMLICAATTEKKIDDNAIIRLAARASLLFINSDSTLDTKMRRLNEKNRLNMAYLAKMIKLENALP